MKYSGIFLLEWLRLLFRRTTRIIVRYGPKFIKNMAAKVPFSRFHKIQSRLCWGEEEISWRGVRIKVNPGEIAGYYPYFLGIYSPHEIDKLIDACRYAHIFVDVGAHTGLISLAIARTYSKLQIFAFEPARDIIPRFRKNISLNPCLSQNIHVIEKAIADTESTLFFQPSLDPENSSIGRLAESETSYTVSAITLDKFFESIGKCPDVAKIDVEGTELRVLAGMKGLFGKGYPKAILLEIHAYLQSDRSAFKTAIKTTLEKAGFTLMKFDNGNWKDADSPEEWPGRMHLFAFRK